MLDNWIRELRLKKNYSDAEQWRYKVSGNTIEFSVPRTSISDKESYRNSVITIGRILKALSQKVEESDFQFHIQSFPNLENPELIASIRIDHANRSRPSFPGIHSAEKFDDALSKLKYISRKYKFELFEIAERELVTFSHKELMKGRKCYALISRFDNPFTWLNLGYLKETLASDCCTDLTDKPQLVINSIFENGRQISRRYNETDYIQALVFI